MKQLRIKIEGVVQGVFFRAFVQETAQNLGLKGYVKNMPDGSVEAVAQGSDDRLQKLVEECKKGPEGSRVDKVETEDQEPEELTGFQILR